jgi:DNA repair protein RadC
MAWDGASELLSIPADERPRERLMRFGPESLGDVELVALVLGGGGSLRRALALFESCGGLLGLSMTGSHELCAVRGIGVAGATAITAAIELAKRLARLELPYSTALRGPDEVARFARATFGDASQETFVVLGLDARARVRLVRTIAIGSVSHVDVHPREVFRPLVRAGMHTAIAVHNHPSGEPEPSQADVELTRRLAEVGRLLGIPLLDHLVVTRTRSVSLAALGVVPGA